MAKIEMVMPQMGEGINEGTIIKWHKKEGEKVEKDEILLEISTDKVDSEIPSPYAGVISKLVAGEGDTIAVGQVIAQLDGEGGAAESAAPSEEKSEPKPEAPAEAETQSNGGGAAPGIAEMVMPQMGEGIHEGTVIKWHKQEGEKVEKDEIILEVSTDKVDSEIPSVFSGVVKSILVKEGETVDVGTVVAKIETADAPVAAVSEQAATVSAPVKPQAAPQPAVATSAVTVETKTTNGQRKFYSPLVRNIAKEEGISHDELSTIEGTGAQGRVTKKDILNYLDRRSTPTAAPAYAAQTQAQPAAPQVQSIAPTDEVEIIPMSSMRKSIASHMLASVQTSPHVFMFTEADMTNLVEYRVRNKDIFLQKTGTKLTYMAFFTQACARALRDFPLVNSSLDGSNIVMKKNVNIGIAVALENSGLIVPVIRNADNLNVVGLARAINDLAARARSKKLKPDEVTGGTFSITNMGTFGSLGGFPIINQPQVAILGLGAIQKRPVVINDAIAVRSMVYLTISFDHRLVDGALAGQFLEKIAFYLTNFDTGTIL